MLDKKPKQLELFKQKRKPLKKPRGWKPKRVTKFECGLC